VQVREMDPTATKLHEEETKAAAVVKETIKKGT
jgi:hypothetical protein